MSYSKLNKPTIILHNHRIHQKADESDDNSKFVQTCRVWDVLDVISSNRGGGCPAFTFVYINFPRSMCLVCSLSLRVKPHEVVLTLPNAFGPRVVKFGVPSMSALFEPSAATTTTTAFARLENATFGTSCAGFCRRSDRFCQRVSSMVCMSVLRVVYSWKI